MGSLFYFKSYTCPCIPFTLVFTCSFFYFLTWYCFFVLGTSTFSRRDETSLYSLFCDFYLNLFLDLLKLLHIALTLVFWTCTLKKRPFLWFCSWFILLEAYIIRNFVLACKLVDFWRSKVDIFYFMPKTLQTYDLHTTFILCNITSNPSQKPCNFIRKYDPFTPNDYFPLAISLNIIRLLCL